MRARFGIAAAVAMVALAAGADSGGKSGTSVTLPLSGPNGGIGQAQPTCSAGQFLSCNGTTCSCSTPSSAAGGAGWTLAQKPTSADSRDDEFETGAFPGNWTVYSGTQDNVNGIDPYAAFGAGSNFRFNWNSMRPGWLLLQSASDGSGLGLQQSFTINTNDFVYVRVRLDNPYNVSRPNTGVAFEINSAAGADPRAGVQLGGGTAGNTIQWYAVNSAHVQTGTNANGTHLLATGSPPIIEYMGIHKVGLNAHFWCAGPNGHWTYLASLAVDASSWPAAVVRLRFFGDTGTGSAGNPIVGLDFVRFKNTATSLP